MRPERLQSLISPLSIDPRRDFIRSTGPDRISIADVGLALAGLQEPYASAFRYRWARAEAALPLLEQHLGAFAAWLAQHEKILQVHNTSGEAIEFPWANLIRLALLEEHFIALREPEVICALLDVREWAWTYRLRRVYTRLRGEIDSWNSSAWHHVHVRFNAAGQGR